MLTYTPVYENRYATSDSVCRRYGGRSQTWLWRQLKRDPKFPKPVKLSNRNYWVLAELDQYDQAKAAERL